ncbi:MAG: helix-turn-helix transcriptional regulator [Lachnospiraceae bacterium]|nr:helix-turn-helix transcriptional regulator [Lachnospiraceae bacterium]MBQ3583402.1 helix-turn-helix transcriptional regulator [Lachnospiraceae bacterium]
MGVNYKKLWIKIAEKEMSNPQVREKAEVSASTFTKLKKNEYVSLESLVKIAIALDCEVGDIVEIVKDEEKAEA